MLINTSAGQSLAINNTGPVDLVVSDIASDLGILSISETAFTLAPGGSKSVTLAFSPTAQGAVTGTLTVSSNNRRPSMTFSVSALVTQPQIAVTPASVAYGDIPVSAPSTETLTVSNNGDGGLIIIRIADDFGGPMVSTPNSFTVAPGASSQVTLTLTPTSTGSLPGLVSVYSNDPNTVRVEVDISSNVVNLPALAVSPDPVDFAQAAIGAATSLTISLTNIGTAILNVTDISLDLAELSVSETAFTVAAGASKSVTLTVAPITLQPFSGQVTIVSDDRNSPYILPLSGNTVIRSTFTINLDQGLNMVSLPNKPGTAYTARSLGDLIGDVTIMVKLDSASQQFSSFLPAYDGGDGFAIQGGQGYIVNTTVAKSVPFTGGMWSDAAAPPQPRLSLPANPEGIWAFVLSGELGDQFNGRPLTVRHLSRNQTYRGEVKEGRTGLG